MILVDSREGSGELLLPLQRAGYPAESCTMAFGDFAWQGRGERGASVGVGVERKTISDLIGSLRSGRLCGHQLPGLRATYDVCWLLVEGEYRVDRRGFVLVQRRGSWVPVPGQMRMDELHKELSTLCYKGGLHLWHTASSKDTVRWLGAHYRWWTDADFDQHRSHLVIYHSTPVLPVSQFRQTVSTLPGIGYKTSLWVEQAFGSLRRAFTADTRAWQDIKGIGTKTAQQIKDVIDGE